MTLQQLANIAARYSTEMAHAMLLACIVKSYATGEPLEIPAQAAARVRRGKRPADEPTDEDWRQLVEGNREARFLYG